MNFISVDLDKLEIEVAQEPKDKSFDINLKRKSIFNKLTPIERIVYYEILYRAVYAEDKRKGVEVDYCLKEPDPWLSAIAILMWQGIIQGLSWDAIKVIVNNALSKMREAGIAPKQKKEKINKKLEVGFTWTKYSDDGKKQYDMFLGIKRVYNRMSETERENVSNIDSNKLDQTLK